MGPLSQEASSLASKRHRHSFITQSHTIPTTRAIFDYGDEPSVWPPFPEFPGRNERQRVAEDTSPTSSGSLGARRLPRCIRPRPPHTLSPSPTQFSAPLHGKLIHGRQEERPSYYVLGQSANCQLARTSGRTAICQTCRIPCSPLLKGATCAALPGSARQCQAVLTAGASADSTSFVGRCV